MGYSANDIKLREPPPEMTRIQDLIKETEKRRTDLLELIEEKRTALTMARAETMLNDTRSAKIRTGLGENALNGFSAELIEVEQTISGLRAKLSEAEQAEREMLYDELVGRVRSEGQRLLQLIAKLDGIVTEHDIVVSEILTLMEKVFWKTDAQAIIGGAGARLPRAVKKLMDPAHEGGNFFLDRLRSFCGEAEELLKSSHDA